MTAHDPLSDIAGLFFPPTCAACGKPLAVRGDFLCNYCRWEIPLTRFWEQADNPVAQKFHGLLPVVHASAFYYFVHHNGFRDLIHDFKYYGRWRLAERMGRWYGSELRESGNYGDVEMIVPVPLHPRKQIRRGYNQSDFIAEGISAAMGLPVDRRSVCRTVNNRSQTKQLKNERWHNVEGIFTVRHPQALDGKHLLLVDDVLTTGATMVSLGEAILRAAPGCRLSVAVLAASRAELEQAKHIY